MERSRRGGQIRDDAKADDGARQTADVDSRMKVQEFKEDRVERVFNDGGREGAPPVGDMAVAGTSRSVREKTRHVQLSGVEDQWYAGN